MDFGEQIKKMREQQNLTQEQLSQKLNISRQAISNWENNRNLPDIEMVIKIANIFNISLDQLIISGGNDMNNMTEKLINDGSETKRAKLNVISISIATALLLIGITLIGLKAVSVEYVDEQGTLHENFFLLPIGFLFILSGVATFFTIGIRNIILLFFDKNRVENKNRVIYSVVSLSIFVLCVIVLLILWKK